jgi:hypothetical protein
MTAVTDEDFPVTCGNGCPDGYLGRHKFSCCWAGGTWSLDGQEVVILGDSVLSRGASGLVCVQLAGSATMHRHVAATSLVRQ